MAKGDVTMVLSAEENKAVTTMLKLRDEMLKTGNTARTMGEHVAKSGDLMMGAFQGAAGAIGLVTSVGAAAAATVGFLVKTVEDQLDRMEKRAQALRETTASLSQGLASAGRAGETVQIGAALEAMANKGPPGQTFSGEELKKVAAPMYQALGHRATPEQIYQGVGVYQQTRGWAGAQLASELAATKTKLVMAGLPDVDPYQAHAAGLSDDDYRAIYRARADGFDPHQAYEAILGGHETEEGPRAVQSIENYAVQHNRSFQSVMDMANPPREVRSAVLAVRAGKAMLATNPFETMQQGEAGALKDPNTRMQAEEANTAAMAQRSDEPLAKYGKLYDLIRQRTIEDYRRAHPNLESWVPDVIAGAQDEQLRYEPTAYLQLHQGEYNRAARKHTQAETDSAQAGGFDTLANLFRENNSLQRTRRDTALHSGQEGQN